MLFRSKAISNPDAFSVNTAMQRCLAKAIALHGLGLYIYAGEDLPEGEGERKPNGAIVGQGVIAATTGAVDSLSEGERGTCMDVAAECINKMEMGDFDGAFDLVESVVSTMSDPQMFKVALWTHFDSRQRSALKKVHEIRNRKAA